MKPEDICMINTGATIGRISFAPDNPETYKTTFQKSVAVIKTIPSLIDNRYCCYLLKSDLKKIVEKLESISEETKKLEAFINKNYPTLKN